MAPTTEPSYTVTIEDGNSPQRGARRIRQSWTGVSHYFNTDGTLTVFYRDTEGARKEDRTSIMASDIVTAWTP